MAVALLPFLGFVINGALSIVAVYRPGPDDPTLASAAHAHQGHDAHDDHEAGHDSHAVVRHRFAGITSLVGAGVLVLSFLVTAAIFFAMRGAGEIHTPFIQRYFSWMPVGESRLVRRSAFFIGPSGVPTQ